MSYVGFRYHSYLAVDMNAPPGQSHFTSLRSPIHIHITTVIHTTSNGTIVLLAGTTSKHPAFVLVASGNPLLIGSKSCSPVTYDDNGMFNQPEIMEVSIVNVQLWDTRL